MEGIEDFVRRRTHKPEGGPERPPPRLQPQCNSPGPWTEPNHVPKCERPSLIVKPPGLLENLFCVNAEERQNQLAPGAGPESSILPAPLRQTAVLTKDAGDLSSAQPAKALGPTR